MRNIFYTLVLLGVFERADANDDEALSKEVIRWAGHWVADVHSNEKFFIKFQDKSQRSFRHMYKVELTIFGANLSEVERRRRNQEQPQTSIFGKITVQSGGRQETYPVTGYHYPDYGGIAVSYESQPSYSADGTNVPRWCRITSLDFSLDNKDFKGSLDCPDFPFGTSQKKKLPRQGKGVEEFETFQIEFNQFYFKKVFLDKI